MFNVTDSVYRSTIMLRGGHHDGGSGAPDAVYTEFVSAAGLCNDVGREKLLPMLAFDARTQRPCVAQLFGREPEHFARAAALCAALGFDALDLNFGCPDAAVVRKQGAGAALIREPERAAAIVRAAVRGAAGALPVSVKTRAGFARRDELDPWVDALLACEPAALTLHARTAKELSKAPADWSMVARAVELAKGSDTLVFGNGDVASTAHAEELCAETGADGAMVGRAVLTNPWFFEGRDVTALTARERVAAVLRHLEVFAAAHGGGTGDGGTGEGSGGVRGAGGLAGAMERKGFGRLQKCFRGYFHAMPGRCPRAVATKRGLHDARTAAEAIEVATAFLQEEEEAQKDQQPQGQDDDRGGPLEGVQGLFSKGGRAASRLW